MQDLKRRKQDGRRKIDDIQLLRSIFLNRIMTKEQIRKMYFHEYPKTSSSPYAKLSRLKKEGLIGSKPLVANGQKIAAMYYVTQKTIDMLYFEELAIDFTKRSYDHRPDWRHSLYHIMNAEIDVQLQPQKAHFVHNVTLKHKSEVNRRSRVSGKITTENGIDYYVYYIRRNTGDEIIEYIRRDIEFHQNKMHRVILMTDTPIEWGQYIRMANTHQMDIESKLIEFNMILTADLVQRIPFVLDYKVREDMIMKHFSEKAKIKKLDKDQLEARYQFADYEITMNGTTYLGADAMMTDLTKEIEINSVNPRILNDDKKKIMVITTDLVKGYFSSMSKLPTEASWIEYEFLPFKEITKDHELAPEMTARLREASFLPPDQQQERQKARKKKEQAE